MPPSPLLLCLPHHDGCNPQTARHNKPFLPQVASRLVFAHNNEKKIMRRKIECLMGDCLKQKGIKANTQTNHPGCKAGRESGCIFNPVCTQFNNEVH